MSSPLTRKMMMAAAGILVPPSPPVYSTWNPSDKAAQITLSNGDLTVSSSTYSVGVRSTVSKSSGKWYIEHTHGAVAAGTTIAIATSAQSLTADWPDDYGYGYYSGDGQKYHSLTGAAYGATWLNAAVIGVAINLDAQELTFYKDGVSQGLAYSGFGAGPWFLFINSGSSGTKNHGTTNFGASAFAYEVPAGFNSGFYD